MKNLIIYILAVIFSVLVVIGLAIGISMIAPQEPYKVETYTDPDNNQEYLIFRDNDGLAVTPRLGREE